MARFDFTPLFTHYPDVIAQMPPLFSSHEFILELAKQHQTEYVSALYAYRDTLHVDTPAPFQVVHGILAAKLKEFSHLVALVRTDLPSKDIFGQPSHCAEWQKVT